MSILIKCLLITLALSISNASEFKNLHVGVPKDPQTFIDKVDFYKLLEPYLNQSTKILFKAWHFIFNRDYDFNSEYGIIKYKTFKSNIKLINEHNAKKLSWQMGINHLTDMTNEEIREYYNLKPLDEKELVKTSLRLFGEPEKVDFFGEKQEKLTGYPQVDYRDKMRPVRDQKNCGGGWAFSITAVLEGCFQNWQEQISDSFSVQQSLDCNTENHGCTGCWWFDPALKYFLNKPIVYDKVYPFTAVNGSCKYSDNMEGNTKVKITGYNWWGKSYPKENFINMLKKGPVATPVDANDEWFRYRSGIFDPSSCRSGMNHAVAVVGYKCESANKCNDNSGCYWIVRNSWGSAFGMEGHIYIQAGKTELSCNVEKYAYQPKAFTK